MKKLLAVAIAAAVAAPVTALAESNVTVYGKIHMLLTNNNTDKTEGSPNSSGPTSSNRAWTVGRTNSRLGFKGTEDLGNGLKAIWKYEMQYQGLDGRGDGASPGSGYGNGGPLGAGDAIGAARNSYVGFAGDWGTFFVGRHDTPYKVAWYAAGLDFLDGSIIDFNWTGPYAGSDGEVAFQEFRMNNTIVYISPSFNGLTIAGAIIPGEGAPSAFNPGGKNNDGIADHYSIGAMYKANAITASAGFESLGYGEESGLDNQNTWFVAGSYTWEGLTFGGSYQQISHVVGTKRDQDAWGLAGKYQFGNNALIANYINQHTNKGGDDPWDAGVALQHFFSKRTSVYGAYNYAKLRDNGSDPVSKQWGAGIIHLF